MTDADKVALIEAIEEDLVDLRMEIRAEKEASARKVLRGLIGAKEQRVRSLRAHIGVDCS